jgi:hypothetical protein
MKKIRITEACRYELRHLAKGTVIELPDQVANVMVQLNRAVRVAELEDREPEIENRDPANRKAKRK